MRIRLLLVGILLAGLATSSFASIITNGTFNIAGEIFVTSTGGVTTPAGTCPVGIACIFWQDTKSPAVNNKVDISAGGLPSGNIPLAIAGTDAANISNLLNPPENVGGSGFAPMPFMTFNNGGVTTMLLLNFIAAGIDGPGGCSASPPAAGQICTPPGSLFNLQNLSPTSSTAGWRLSGITNDSSATWTGTFTSQFNTMSFQQVLAGLATTGFVQNTFSASITLQQNAVPEPGTLSFLLLGSGMIVCATLLRRLSRR